MRATLPTTVSAPPQDPCKTHAVLVLSTGGAPSSAPALHPHRAPPRLHRLCLRRHQRGACSVVSGRGYREYRLGEYSTWLQRRVEDADN
ncbi:hypothetical protein ZWY2020_037744 [Hordeum vulgare]|nr:hypothetical protein ZWY2020_037744 [Hordeum vulgare]